MRIRPGLTRGCELGKPWRSVVGGRQGMGSRGSCRRTRLTMTTTTMMMMKTTTWRLGLASAWIRGWTRGHQANLQVGWRHQSWGPGRWGLGPRSGGRPRGYLTPWPR
jgi:hypothetical protein